mgnify:CR=1 FL=1
MKSIWAGAVAALLLLTAGSALAGEPIEPHQVRLSNGPAICAMLAAHGYRDSRHDHLVDEKAELERRIGKHLEEADVLADRIAIIDRGRLVAEGTAAELKALVPGSASTRIGSSISVSSRRSMRAALSRKPRL